MAARAPCRTLTWSEGPSTVTKVGVGEHLAAPGGVELVNGRYRVVRKLGEGAMGEVHLVADTLDDDRLVALKTVRAGLRQNDRSFRDEFSAMAQLRHPNVVEVYDFGTLATTGDLFFTMEYVDGK